MKYLQSCLSLTTDCCDVVVFVNDGIYSLGEEYEIIKKALEEYLQIHPEIEDTCKIIPFHSHPCGRLIYSPTGSLNTEFADSQNIYYAAYKGIKKAIKSKYMKQLLVLGDLRTAQGDEVWMQEDYPKMNAILGGLQAYYTAIKIGEAIPERNLYVYGASERLLEIVCAMEEGRRLTYDIRCSDYEKMSVANILECIQNEFASSPEITIKFVDESKYPLMAAVNLEQDQRLLILNYSRKDIDNDVDGVATVDTTLFMVGDGVVFDTTDCDVTAKDHVVRTKWNRGGAAAIAGFFKTLSLLKPKGLSVIGLLAFVQKSRMVKPYGAYESITSRSGRRVNVGNIVGNSCMVMADLLCEAKELALDAKNPFLFTIGSLTDLSTTNENYTALMDNGPAREKHVSSKLKNAGDKISDVSEIVTLRRMVLDLEFYEVLPQFNNLLSYQPQKRNQLHVAFMIEASGLCEHGSGSMSRQLPYTHVDISRDMNKLRTAPPILMFTACYVLSRL